MDDAFSELDALKKKNLFNYISNNQQVFITCTDYRNIIDNKSKNKTTLFHIDKGVLVERSII